MYKIYIDKIINIMDNRTSVLYKKELYKKELYKKELEIGKEIYKLFGNDGLLIVINSIIDTLNERGYSNVNIEYIHGLENCWNKNFRI